MKRIVVAAVLVIAFSTASFSRKPVAKGETYTTLGKYKIELADNQVPLKGEDCKTYVVSYENSPMEATIAVCKDKNCRTYVVLSDKLSVQYVCTDMYFGVQKLDKAFEKGDRKSNNSALNREEFFHQKILTPGNRSELEATQLIAAYFPRLINGVTEAVASR
jgi:hypothetical protein